MGPFLTSYSSSSLSSTQVTRSARSVEEPFSFFYGRFILPPAQLMGPKGPYDPAVGSVSSEVGRDGCSVDHFDFCIQKVAFATVLMRFQAG